MSVIPYKKVEPRKFIHNFPGVPIFVDVTRFLVQVQLSFSGLSIFIFIQVYPRTSKLSASLVWKLDEEDFDAVIAVSNTIPPYTKNALLPQATIDKIIDPDDIEEQLDPKFVKKQAAELRQLQPLRATTACHVEPFLNLARHHVWTILNSGGPDVRQARKTAYVYGWDESLFLKVFENFGTPEPVTVRRNAPIIPPIQPECFEAAWVTRKRRELQLVLCAGKALDKWFSFHVHYPPTSTRFFAEAGYKQVSAKMVVEVAAIHTTDTRRVAGKECRVALFVSTVFVNSQRQVIHSPLRWESSRPLPSAAAVNQHALNFFDKMHDVASTEESKSTPTAPIEISSGTVTHLSDPPASSVLSLHLSSPRTLRSPSRASSPVLYPLVFSDDEDENF